MAQCCYHVVNLSSLIHCRSFTFIPRQFYQFSKMICTVQWVEVGTDSDRKKLGVRVRYVNKKTPVSPFWSYTPPRRPLYDHHQFSAAQAPIVDLIGWITHRTKLLTIVNDNSLRTHSLCFCSAADKYVHSLPSPALFSTPMLTTINSGYTPALTPS